MGANHPLPPECYDNQQLRLPRVASVYQIVCKYLHLVLRLYYHFTKFNMAAIRRLGFVGGSHGTTHERPFIVAIF